MSADSHRSFERPQHAASHAHNEAMTGAAQDAWKPRSGAHGSNERGAAHHPAAETAQQKGAAHHPAADSAEQKGAAHHPTADSAEQKGAAHHPSVEKAAPKMLPSGHIEENGSINFGNQDAQNSNAKSPETQQQNQQRRNEEHSRSYDANNKLREQKDINNDGSGENTKFDANGSLSQATSFDGKGNYSRRDYKDGRMTGEEIKSAEGLTKTSWDNQGNSHSESFASEGKKLRERTSDQNGYGKDTIYNTDGGRTEHTTALNSESTKSYDSQGRALDESRSRDGINTQVNWGPNGMKSVSKLGNGDVLANQQFNKDGSGQTYRRNSDGTAQANVWNKDKEGSITHFSSDSKVQERLDGSPYVDNYNRQDNLAAQGDLGGW